MNWEKHHFECILSNIIAITFGKYMILHQLDVKNHVSDQLCKQNFSILRTFGYLFWQLPEKCTFWDFGLKSGDFQHQNLQKGADHPQYGTLFEGNCKLVCNFLGFLVFFGFRTILSYFRVFWRPFWTILSIIHPINFGKYMVLHRIDVK